MQWSRTTTGLTAGWQAGEAAVYFKSTEEFGSRMDELIINADRLATLRLHALVRFQEAFTWPDVLAQYEQLLTHYMPTQSARDRPTSV